MTDSAELLRAIAVPRLVGTPNHARVRQTLKRELAARGFEVEEHAFAATPSRLGSVALAGACVAWGAIGTVLLLFLSGQPWMVVGWTLTVVVVTTHLLITSRARTGAGAEAAVHCVNLIARRPASRPSIWLVAHYDSKGQPISMATRIVGAACLMVGAVAALGALAVGWMMLPGVALLAVGTSVMARNRVTDASPGAVDNASAVVAVFAILDLLPPGAALGVLFTDAEEWGLLGARALVRERGALLDGAAVVNLDGIDDRGRPIAFTHRRGPVGRAVAAELGAVAAPWLPVLVDGIALARGSRDCVTIMRGDWQTTRVVHTPLDTAERLTLEGVRQVAAGVARALASP